MAISPSDVVQPEPVHRDRLLDLETIIDAKLRASMVDGRCCVWVTEEDPEVRRLAVARYRAAGWTVTHSANDSGEWLEFVDPTYNDPNARVDRMGVI